MKVAGSVAARTGMTGAALLLATLLLAPAVFSQKMSALAAPASTAMSDNQITATSQVPAASGLRIGPGDLLTINIFDVPELQQVVRVSDSGEAVLLLVGNIRLGGLTVAAAQTVLEQEYRKRNFLLNPQVSILVTEYATQGISVMGEVTKPGVYPLQGPHTLLEIISAAGGLTQLAGSTVSVRSQDGAERVVHLDANDPQKALAQDVELKPADTVVVSRAAIVYVVGDVGKPGGFAMQNNGTLTVLQAIALASGVNKTASLSHSKIIHRTPSGAQETDIHLSALLQGKSPDLPLEPEDILFVPNSKLKTAAAGSFNSVVQAATTAIVYSIHP
jgi:polysaccharide biosynthesis/export protein